MKLRPFLSALVIALLLVPGYVSAQTTWELTPWIGTAFTIGDVGEAVTGPGIDIKAGNINAAPVYGLSGGVRVGGHFMVEGLFSYMPSTYLVEATFDGDGLLQGYGLDVVTYGANLGWAFSSSKTSVVPYLSAGAGAMSFSADQLAKDSFTGIENSTEFMWNIGGGLGIPITETSRLRIEVRDYVVSTMAPFSLFPSDETGALNTFILSAGFTVHTR